MSIPKRLNFRPLTRNKVQIAYFAIALTFAIFSTGEGVATLFPATQVSEHSAQHVNRAGKGDRLLRTYRHHQQRDIVRQPRPAEDLKLPEGCEAIMSSIIVDDRLAQMASRCMS